MLRLIYLKIKKKFNKNNLFKCIRKLLRKNFNNSKSNKKLS